MSHPVYRQEYFIWPGTHEIVPENTLATSIPSVFLRLCILLMDNYSITNARNCYYRIRRDMCSPIYQLLESASYVLAVIRQTLLMHGVNIDAETFNGFRLSVVLCALDMAESPLYSEHTVLPMFIWVTCTTSRPAIYRVPAELLEEEDDDYEDEDEEEQEHEEEQEGEEEEGEEGEEAEQEEQDGEQEEEEDDENDNQQELPAEDLVMALVVDGVTCTVCHDELEAGSIASMLPCFHFFHEPCIRRWLTYKRICPNCRSHLG